MVQQLDISQSRQASIGARLAIREDEPLGVMVVTDQCEHLLGDGVRQVELQEPVSHVGASLVRVAWRDDALPAVDETSAGRGRLGDVVEDGAEDQREASLGGQREPFDLLVCLFEHHRRVDIDVSLRVPFRILSGLRETTQ